MFLHQKIGGYKVYKIDTEQDIQEMQNTFYDVSPQFSVFDTETTGLNYIKDVPFLFIFGFGKHIYHLDMFAEIAPRAIEVIYILMSKCKRTFAHNTKYDWHMMYNAGYEIPSNVKLADGYTIARLTNYADDVFNKSLEEMGRLYVDETAKFAGKVIKEKLHKIKAERKKVLQALFKTEFKNVTFGKIWEAYGSRVQFIPHEYDDYFRVIDEFYQEPNYFDVYQKHPNLMISYAVDDCVILNEWLEKALPLLSKVDPDKRVFNRECDLLVPSAQMDRVGFLADVGYLLESHTKMLEYKDKLYQELHDAIGEPLTVNQHKELKRVFLNKFGIALDSVDKKALNRIAHSSKATRIASLIIELRTIDKWISTYIEGTLNKIIDGRLYSKKGVDNAGAVSGRVSSDLQQQPKEAFVSQDGVELFHPRKAFLADDDYYLMSFDYSQQELRVQAYYTILTSGGDDKLLRAYMPFKCYSLFSGEQFDYTNPTHLQTWNSGEWIEEDTEEFWTPTDVHDETTFTAFPEMNRDKNHPDFKHNRKLGKVCNFLKNYQGGIGAIIDQLNISEELAKILDQAYYDTFPKIKDYQNWVVDELRQKGYVENVYGRRYYFKESRWFYKAGNYLVQGSSADMLKEVQIKLYEILKNTKSTMVHPVHDEILIAIHKDEVGLVEVIKFLMEDVPQIPYVPILCDVEYTDTNWAEMKGWYE